MARAKERKKAIELRLQGKSYSEIRSKLGINKSTLSGWLKNYPLSKNQVERLKEKIPLRIERYRATRAKQREIKDRLEYAQQKKFWVPLSKRELILAGLFLYWGEGTKAGTGIVSISNCDPRVIKFGLMWLKNCLNVPQEAISVRLHLYSDMDSYKEMNFWSKSLQLPTSNFKKPYIKESTRSGLTYKSFGHGTCNLIVSSTLLKSKIMKGIEVISDSYAKVDII